MRSTENVTGPAFSISIVASYPNSAGMLGILTSAIGSAKGDVQGVDLLTTKKGAITRAFSVNASSEEHAQRIVSAVGAIDGVKIIKSSDATFDWHHGGKIGTLIKRRIAGRGDMSMAYTPGVGRVSTALAKDPSRARELTSKGNSVAIVSDGTAVLGLGNIGPLGALPVMEGKALLFKQFADIDAWPLVVDTKNPDEVIATVKAIAPGFGGINLEDIAAPNCFHIEDKLREELDIPVFHDDQHGTAVVVLAGLLNATKVIGKDLKKCKVVVLGPGAAGTACTKLLLRYGIKNIVVFNRTGALHADRDDLNGVEHLEWLAQNTNPDGFAGNLEEGLKGADVFLGVAGPKAVQPEWLEQMTPSAIVFALSNPIPEIMPNEVPNNIKVMATGRSDFPNQVNNSICFPGFFRGLLDARATKVTYRMKLDAALALSNVLGDENLSEELILPSMFDTRIVKTLSEAVRDCALKDG